MTKLSEAKTMRIRRKELDRLESVASALAPYMPGNHKLSPGQAVRLASLHLAEHVANLDEDQKKDFAEWTNIGLIRGNL